MNILALDLGTKTGYALNNGSEFRWGTWTLATAKDIRAAHKTRLDRRRDPRILQLHRNLGQLVAPYTRLTLDAVVFEDVQFASYTLQVQLWSSLRAAVWLSYGPSVLFNCVPVATLKKFATGNGAATKEAMAAALVLKDTRFESTALVDDNAVDAVWLHRWATENLSRL